MDDRDPIGPPSERTVGGRLADRVASLGGSWTFIGLFLSCLAAWAVLNTVVLADTALVFDAYPYIFLNLMLSMLASLQAPIIMMSQNRQAARDRAAASLDHATNVEAEREIEQLHAKLDRLATLHPRARSVRRPRRSIRGAPMKDRDDETTPAESTTTPDAARWDGEGGAAATSAADALSAEEGRMLRVLGAAVIGQWNVLPTVIRRQLFEAAMTNADPPETVVLKQQIARFLHDHKDDDQPTVV